MSTALPGQRAGQRPLRAAVATQRAIGRSLGTTGAMADTLVLHTEDGWQQVVIDPDHGGEVLVPYDFNSQEG